MKIQTKNTTITEVEVSLPLYRKDGCHFYKIYGEGRNECVQVCTLAEQEGIQRVFNALSFETNLCTDCTAEEFETAFVLVNALLNEIALDKNSVKA